MNQDTDLRFHLAKARASARAVKCEAKISVPKVCEDQYTTNERTG